MLQHLYVIFSVRRGQDRTRSLAKDLLNDQNAIYFNIDDVMNFSSNKFTPWLTLLTPIFYIDELLVYMLLLYYVIIMLDLLY